MTRVIALYLPQFHPIPENDLWWGKGFTEWTNVGRAKPLFKGHYQPKVPADLGYYDLRLPEVREEQARLAKSAGIEGFCYYHYWFGNNKILLERPFKEVLESGKPDFPFCLCWANHTWSNKTWEKSSSKVKSSVLAKQEYLGEKDHIEHFNYLLPAFKDTRYMKIDGKLIFTIYDPIGFKDVSNFMAIWRRLAEENNLPGFHFIGMTPATLSFKILPNGETESSLPNLKNSADIYNHILSLGFDAVNSFGKRRGELIYDGKFKNLAIKGLQHLGINFPHRYDYSKTVANYFPPEDAWENVYPTILPQWDRTARVGKADGVYVNSTPEKFKEHVLNAKSLIAEKSPEHQVLFLKSWNEWAEGNYMEPDLVYGHGYINALREAVD